MILKDFSIFLYDLGNLPEGHPRRHTSSPARGWEALLIVDGRASFEREASRENALRLTLGTLRWNVLMVPPYACNARREDLLPWWGSAPSNLVRVEGNRVLDAVSDEPLWVGRYEIQVSKFDCESPIVGLPFEDEFTMPGIKRLRDALRRSIRAYASFLVPNAKDYYCEMHLRRWADLVWDNHEIRLGLPSNSGYGSEFRDIVLTPETLTRAKDAKTCPSCDFRRDENA